MTRPVHPLCRAVAEYCVFYHEFFCSFDVSPTDRRATFKKVFKDERTVAACRILVHDNVNAAGLQLGWAYAFIGAASIDYSVSQRDVASDLGMDRPDDTIVVSVGGKPDRHRRNWRASRFCHCPGV